MSNEAKTMWLNDDSDRIIVEGYGGKWYVIDTGYYKGIKLFLLEHETFGDETEHLIVDGYCNIIMDDVWNGFDDLD